MAMVVMGGMCVQSITAIHTTRGVASIEAEEAVASSLFADLVVRWVRTNPPSSLQYQLFLRVLDCKHSKNSLAAGWSTRGSAGPATGRNAVSVIIDGRVPLPEIIIQYTTPCITGMALQVRRPYGRVFRAPATILERLKSKKFMGGHAPRPP